MRLPPALFVSWVLLVATAKKAKNVALVAGTKQNLSNLKSNFNSLLGRGVEPRIP
jgi:hypothetical protein